MNTFKLEILTPYKKYFECDASFLSVRNDKSVLGILPGHESLISSLLISPCIVEVDGKRYEYAISGGLIKIEKNVKVTLLVNSIERKDEIDIERAREAKQRAEARLLSKDDNIDVTRAKTALAKALNRISVVEGIK